jgi:drug/metabolite transporter (DMT)-like permease
MLALGRWTLALLLMLPLVWRDAAALHTPWRREWPQLLVLEALGMWICGALVYLGAHSTSATNIGPIYATTPVGITVAGRWELHDPGKLAQVRVARGELWILVAAVSCVAYSVLQQRLPSAPGRPAPGLCHLLRLAGAAALHGARGRLDAGAAVERPGGSSRRAGGSAAGFLCLGVWAAGALMPV